MTVPHAIAGQPPLTRWQQTWRYLAALAISVTAFAGPGPQLWGTYPVWFWADVTLGALTFALLPFRRRWPVPVTALIGVAGLLSALSAGPFTVTMISLSTRRRWREIIPVGAVSAAAGVVYFSIVPTVASSWYLTIVFNVVVLAVLVASGLYVGARRELVATLKDRADRAEREQGLRVAQARTQERALIAREMHDVLAHRMSLVAMHAGALAYRDDLSPAEANRTARLVQDMAHEALTDLRAVLGVLREDEATGTLQPLPTLRDVPQLVAEARTAGMQVALDNQVADLAAAPDAIGRHAYRMVQETLTNARKHAPDTAVRVRLDGAPGGELSVEVRNPLRLGASVAAAGSVPSSGLGLVGLAERATLSGGRFEHGPNGTSEFVVRVWLPWPA